MNDFGKKKFKQFAKKNRLRIKTAEDGNPIVVARGKKFQNCFLFEGFGDDYVGLYIVKNTPGKLTYLANKLERMGLDVLNRGDYEASFKIPYARVMAIAKTFSMIKRKVSDKSILKLKEWREKQG